MLVFVASAVAEDKPSGDNTAAQDLRLRVAWLAIQFLAAAAISGLATDMPPPSDDKEIPGIGQVVADADRATTAYLNDAERQQLMTMFRLALTDTDRQLLMAEDGTAYVKTGDIPASRMAARFKCAGATVAVLCT
jgi:hypothetical protein